MVAPQKDLSARQRTDIFQIFFAVLELLSPAVISDQDERILLPDEAFTVLPEFTFVILPHLPIKLSGRFQLRLKVQVQVTYSIKTHNSSITLL